MKVGESFNPYTYFCFDICDLALNAVAVAGKEKVEVALNKIIENENRNRGNQDEESCCQ